MANASVLYEKRLTPEEAAATSLSRIAWKARPGRPRRRSQAIASPISPMVQAR